MTVLEALRLGHERLEKKEVPDARLDAEYLLAHVLSLPRLNVMVEKMRKLTPEQASAYDSLLTRRETREPLQYILGEQSFMGFSFKVDRRALIPRNDTELLCEEALRLIRPGHTVLDLCTGSGCLAIAIKKLCPQAYVVGTDISEDALSLARENAEALKADVVFRRGDLFAPVHWERYHMIVSNPPYVPSALADSVQTELKWEPPQALFADEAGTALLSWIIFEAPYYLRPGGRLLLEFGDGQANEVAKMLSDHFEHIHILADWQGLLRVASAQLREGHDLKYGRSI